MNLDETIKHCEEVAQIAALYVRKWYDEKPRVEVQIRTVTDE